MAEVKELYEVVQTLIRGKQSERRIETQSGVKVTAHKKPVGYALKNLKTNKIMVVKYLEAIELVAKYGATNAQVTITRRNNGNLIPYIRSKADEENLQSEKMVEDPLNYVRTNKKVEISPAMNEIIQEYMRVDTKNDKLIPPKYNYTKKQIIDLVEEMKAKENQNIQ